MNQAAFTCDGSLLPSPNQTEIQRVVATSGSQANLAVGGNSVTGPLLDSLSGRASDLVRIASYVYAADQMQSRGGDRDAHAANWKRSMRLGIPVGDPEFWSSISVMGQLGATLGYLTDDEWSFTFSEAIPNYRQVPINSLENTNLLGEPNCVILFSGGTDSLCATIEAVKRHSLRPLLVSHTPAPNLSDRQLSLLTQLESQLSVGRIPRITFPIHRRGRDAAEYSQRSRGFLYASLAAAVAHELGIPNILFADNGVVSLNLPISPQVVGAMASRATHPKFLNLFNDLSETVLSELVRISNPLLTRTRVEVLQILKDTGTESLLENTISCSHSRGRPLATPQCGTCSQCVDRRFATIAADLTDYDPAERYGTDVFLDDLEPGNPRTYALSYVRFARQVEFATDDQMVAEYPQLIDTVPVADSDGSERLSQYCDLLRRHGRTVTTVLEEAIKDKSSNLVHEQQSPFSLIGLTIGLSTRGDPSVSFPLRTKRQSLLEAPEIDCAIAVFYSYSHRDVKYKAALEEHLTLLKREGLISEWSDRQISAGQYWDTEIHVNFEKSRIILLLVSSSFLSSDYCWGVEFTRALERNQEGSARAIPIRVRPIDLAGSIIGDLQYLPPGSRAITERRPQDSAWVEVSAGIRQVIRELSS